MAWFWESKQSKKGKKTARGRGKGRSRNTRAPFGPDWDPQRTLAVVRWLTISGVVIVVAVGWGYAEQWLGDYAQRLHVSEMRAMQQNGTTSAIGSINSTGENVGGGVVLVNQPGWMSPLLRQEIDGQVLRELGTDPLDGSDLMRVARVLSQNPWVAQVQRVQRKPHGQIDIEATFREPVAVVEGRDGYHLVDAGAVRLPGLYLKHQLDALGLPLLVGVGSAPRGEGEVWPGDDLRAGIDLVLLLDEAPYQGQIVSYDVSGRDARGRVRLSLLTTHGVVRWGLAPRLIQAVEPDAMVKKDRLASVYQQRGEIDAGGKVVELFGPRVFVHQPDYAAREQALSSSH